jgi:hypothetical protein
MLAGPGRCASRRSGGARASAAILGSSAGSGDGNASHACDASAKLIEGSPALVQHIGGDRDLTADELPQRLLQRSRRW